MSLKCRDVAQSGSAPCSGRGGRKFESCHPDFFMNLLYLKIISHRIKGDFKMKKSFKIEVDCANCANLMEETAKNTFGVKDAVVNFIAQKMDIEFNDEADVNTVIKEVIKNCKKIEDDIEIYE